MDTRVGNGHREQLGKLGANLRQVIRGKDEAVEVLLVALLAGGSVLLEDVPGTGKTTLAKALAISLHLAFNRVQFTPDLLPADILGSSIYNPVSGSFTFRPGPIFCNLLLGDEINRASPRTQSALLEAMSEAQVTIEGVRHVLEPPFMVLATQNPVEFQGTYPLPEAQLDRFMVLLSLGYPTEELEVEILAAQGLAHPIESLQPVLDQADVLAMQAAVRQVRMEATIARYIVELVNATRRDVRLKLGASTRGALMLHRAAQAAAFIAGRDYVTPDDVQAMAPYVLPHRLILTPEARYGGIGKADIVREIVGNTKTPA